MEGKRRLYVYYKLPAAEHDAWVPRVREFLGILRARYPGLKTELLRRPTASTDGAETWMEVFRHPEGVDDALLQDIQREASKSELPSPRAAEVFVDC